MASAASTSNALRKQQEGGVVSWCDLPSDLYGHILRRLCFCRDRVRLSAVCRHWRVCARQLLPRLPMRVTRTARGTHVVHVRGLSRLQHVVGGGFIDSPAFDVAGLHWAIRIRYNPGSDGGDVGGSVMLLTEGAVVRAYVGVLLLDQTTGLPATVIWDEHTTRFDAASACTRDNRKFATRSELIRGSRFVRGDCLKIEYVLDDVCQDSTC